MTGTGGQLRCFGSIGTTRRSAMAKQQTARGRKQDRAKVAAGQDHEVRYEAKKEGVPNSEVKAAVKSVGNSRRKVEERIEGAK
jgi:hypothetical protein